MEIYHALAGLPTSARGAVVVIGNFDGVHRGHQALLARARDLARASGRPFALLTFEPHPRALFQPDAPPYRITPPDIKADRLREAGVDLLFSLKFDWEFASQSAEDFIRHILIEGLGAAHVVVGYDFRFGQLRKGGPEDIRAAGLDVTIISEILDAGDGELSSSRIRNLLRQGEISRANDLLGWEWEMRGAVVRGDQRGRELGFPTANFALGETVHPAYGVYAARVQVEGSEVWHGAAVNIGIRPMFELKTAQVESYIFDFSETIYGRILRVRPVRRLRGEARFNALGDLIAQMHADCDLARKILSATE